jgi:hypothetical protein
VTAVEHEQPPSREDDTTLGSDLTRSIHEGIDVEEGLWWTLYHRFTAELRRIRWYP